MITKKRLEEMTYRLANRTGGKYSLEWSSVPCHPVLCVKDGPGYREVSPRLPKKDMYAFLSGCHCVLDGQKGVASDPYDDFDADHQELKERRLRASGHGGIVEASVEAAVFPHPMGKRPK